MRPCPHHTFFGPPASGPFFGQATVQLVTVKAAPVCAVLNTLRHYAKHVVSTPACNPCNAPAARYMPELYGPTSQTGKPRTSKVKELPEVTQLDNH